MSLLARVSAAVAQTFPLKTNLELPWDKWGEELWHFSKTILQKFKSSDRSHGRICSVALNCKHSWTLFLLCQSSFKKQNLEAEPLNSCCLRLCWRCYTHNNDSINVFFLSLSALYLKLLLLSLVLHWPLSLFIWGMTCDNIFFEVRDPPQLHVRFLVSSLHWLALALQAFVRVSEFFLIYLSIFFSTLHNIEIKHWIVPLGNSYVL